MSIPEEVPEDVANDVEKVVGEAFKVERVYTKGKIRKLKIQVEESGVKVVVVFVRQYNCENRYYFYASKAGDGGLRFDVDKPYFDEVVTEKQRRHRERMYMQIMTARFRRAKNYTVMLEL